MIYWNHSGEWWPFFDNIPILQLPLQSFYAFYNFFLLISILAIFLTGFLLFSFSNKGELVILVKRGLTLGRKKKWKLIVNCSVPVLISIIFLFLEIFNFISKVDWLMFVIVYPLIVMMLMILIPLAKKKDNKDQDVPKDRLKINLIKTIALLILIWAICFLPLLLTGILDHMYALLLVELSVSLIIVAFFEIIFNHRKYGEKLEEN